MTYFFNLITLTSTSFCNTWWSSIYCKKSSKTWHRCSGHDMKPSYNRVQKKSVIYLDTFFFFYYKRLRVYWRYFHLCICQSNWLYDNALKRLQIDKVTIKTKCDSISIRPVYILFIMLTYKIFNIIYCLKKTTCTLSKNLIWKYYNATNKFYFILAKTLVKFK